MPRRAACQAASQPASPPPTTATRRLCDPAALATPTAAMQPPRANPNHSSEVLPGRVPGPPRAVEIAAGFERQPGDLDPAPRPHRSGDCAVRRGRDPQMGSRDAAERIRGIRRSDETERVSSPRANPQDSPAGCARAMKGAGTEISRRRPPPLCRPAGSPRDRGLRIRSRSQRNCVGRPAPPIRTDSRARSDQWVR